MITISRHDVFGVELPPSSLVSSEPIAQAVEAYQATKRQRVEAWNAATDTAARRAEAVELDSQLLADSLEHGEEDPGSPNVLRVDAEVAAARRKAGALDLLLQRRLDAVQAALNEASDEWLDSLRLEHAEAVRHWHGALDLLAEAHARLTALAAVERFSRSGRWWAHVANPTVDDHLAALNAVYTVEPVEIEPVGEPA